MRSSLLLAALAVVATVHGQEMTITLAGTEVGTNVATANPDGTVKSVTSMDLMGDKSESTATLTFTTGALTKLAADLTASKSKMKLEWIGETFTMVPEKGNPFKKALGLTPGLILSNLHPQTLRALPKVLPLPGSTKADILIFESGQLLKFPVENLGPAPRGTTKFKINVGVDFFTYIDGEGRVVAVDVPAQQFRFMAKGFDEVVDDPLRKYPELSQPTYKQKTLSKVMVPMRDKVELAATIVMPETTAKVPTILIRTPYGRAAQAATAGFWAKRGYAVVAQDCRGRHDSGGDWDPFMSERPDGYDTIDWIAKQPWSDGKVGMIGGSYSGAVQWQAAVEGHPALKCIVPQVSPPDAMFNLPYCYGNLMLYGNLWWSFIVRGKESDFSQMQGGGNPLKLDTLPLANLPKEFFGLELPFWNKWLARDSHDDWRGWNFQEDMRRVRIPALHISGWWDGDNIGTRTNWQLMRKLGRKNQWLIYGPWEHAFNTKTSYAGVDYGSGAILELDSLYLRWFDTWLKGKSVNLEKVPRAKYFVTGVNEWREADGWPGSNVQATKLYFAPGSLESQPAESKPSSYNYDPNDLGLASFVASLAKPELASTEIKLNEMPGDELVFQTPVLNQPLELSGPIHVDFHFSSTAEDASFYVSLADVDPSGTMRMIGMPGSFRASYLNPRKAPKAIQPGRVYKGRIEVWDTAHQFRRGHRLAVVLNSNYFPLYERNLGFVEPRMTATKSTKATHTIFHDRRRPSSISFYTPKATAQTSAPR